MEIQWYIDRPDGSVYVFSTRGELPKAGDVVYLKDYGEIFKSNAGWKSHLKFKVSTAVFIVQTKTSDRISDIPTNATNADDRFSELIEAVEQGGYRQFGLTDDKRFKLAAQSGEVVLVKVED